MALKWSARFAAVLFFPLTLALLTVTWARAGGLEQTAPPTPAAPDCRECHWDIFVTWEESAHGRGLSCGQCHLANQQDNHARLGHGAQGGPQQCMGCHTTGYDPVTDTWQEDDIHCSACHQPLEPDHPNKPMPIDRSVELCGKCHIQARFEWEVSTHGQLGVACVSCHNQHKTSLRADSDNVSDQCATCHESRTSSYADTAHAQKGISCGECHLAPLEGPLGEGNAKRNHTFEVDLATCVSCHTEQLHKKGQAAESPDASLAMSNEPVDAMASGVTAPVSAQPDPVYPLGFMSLALSVGIGLGMVATIWLNRLDARRMGNGR